MLWAATDSGPKQIEWCRVKRREASGLGDWWFDVVTHDYFNHFITDLTRHYRRELLKLGARQGGTLL
jgi:hypothetical protein